MKYKLIKEINEAYTATQQILFNRGIIDFIGYLNTTDDDINKPAEFGEELLRLGVKILISAISADKKILIIVDADCDGFTSAALLINYLYDLFPAYVLNNVHWYIHNGKQHGLSDCFELASEYDLVILPDSSSNDYEYHKILKNKNIDILILDHHEAEKISEFACVINNQLSNYPNKEFSGVGVTWQFCRYIDKLMNKDFANTYLDLVALGNMADMMSMTSFETKHLIQKGFEPKNIKNPFIYEMWQKNKFKLGDHITPMGAAFYIAPFVNAIVRSGELEEKHLIFNSMLKFKAFEQILSNKRGHKPGETERLVDQAIRTCTNVKNRQTRAQDAGMELIEGLIEKHNMMEHKVLLFLLEPGQIDRNIAGLCANKIMAKYQRPCCILTKVVEMHGGDMKPTEENFSDEISFNPTHMTISYQGSARGCDKSGITNFKDICGQAPGVMFAEGHQGAFGLGIHWGEEDSECPEVAEMNGEFIYQFLDYTDEALKDMSDEPVYYVDYIFTPENCPGDKILEIADLEHYWGKDFDEALVCVKGIKITSNNLKVMASNTIKIELPSGVNIIKFGSTDEEIEKFKTEGFIEIDAVCQCASNEWNWAVYPQLKLVDYEIVNSCAYYF